MSVEQKKESEEEEEVDEDMHRNERLKMGREMKGNSMG